MTHPSDPANMNTDDNLFSNIKRSHLLNIVARTLVLPCWEPIQWNLKHTNIKRIIVVNDNKQCIASFSIIRIGEVLQSAWTWSIIDYWMSGTIS